MSWHPQRYLLTGVLTVIPVAVTVFVFDFFLRQLSNVGRPMVRAIAKAVHPYSPDFARWLLEVPWFQSLLAILLTILVIYLLGWAVSRILGRRILHLLESLVARIPLVTKVYGATKQVVQAFQTEPSRNLQRVVLIEFPNREMKAVGFVTQTYIEAGTGLRLAAVYVPTTPNPTSGYLEIVPQERLVSLDWTVDEAMTFVISGGIVSPTRIQYSAGVPAPTPNLDADAAREPKGAEGPPSRSN